ncbi:hypothetical protein bAD24_III04910 [Burkholderia sp. AD24]|nr:hypothetical protein bAD24_III04910 [Burkholderia sp. AD24]
MNVSVRSYLSPTLVLLAFDWPEGATRQDFLGFAVKRTPGFLSADGQEREASSWLPNRLTFTGVMPDTQKDAPSNEAPIQKFMWWDARIDEADRQKSFTYLVFPVVGTAGAPQLLDAQKAECRLTLPAHIEANVGSWFNRAVVSSQAFSRKVAALHLAPHAAPSAEQALSLRTWLANDLQDVFALTLGHVHHAASAVYHLTDPLWAIPAFETFGKKAGKAALAIVYDSHEVEQKGKPPAPSPNQPAVDQLADVATFSPRDKTHIMHDKFIVVDDGNAHASPARVLTGSANFTTEGITEQANVLHLFESPELATLYSDRAEALAGNPGIADTAKLTPGWSDSIQVGSAKVRVCFSPEPKTSRMQIDTIVDAINNAKHSVVFCLFMPTDAPLRDACFAAGDKGKMMFGLVNHISAKSADEADAAQKAGKNCRDHGVGQHGVVPPRSRPARRDRRRVFFTGNRAGRVRTRTARVSRRACAELRAGHHSPQVSGDRRGRRESDRLYRLGEYEQQLRTLQRREPAGDPRSAHCRYLSCRVSAAV